MEGFGWPRRRWGAKRSCALAARRQGNDCYAMLSGMFLVTPADAVVIRAAFDAGGELLAAVGSYGESRAARGRAWAPHTGR